MGIETRWHNRSNSAAGFPRSAEKEADSGIKDLRKARRELDYLYGLALHDGVADISRPYGEASIAICQAASVLGDIRRSARTAQKRAAATSEPDGKAHDEGHVAASSREPDDSPPVQADGLPSPTEATDEFPRNAVIALDEAVLEDDPKEELRRASAAVREARQHLRLLARIGSSP